MIAPEPHGFSSPFTVEDCTNGRVLELILETIDRKVTTVSETHEVVVRISRRINGPSSYGRLSVVNF